MSPMRRASALIVIAALLVAWAAPAEARKRSKRRGRTAPPVPALTRDGWPNVMAAAAVVIDLDKGEELYAKNPDDKRFIASVGKIFVALVVRDKEIPLEGKTSITEEDKQFARGGARSRLLVGKTFTNVDLLRAMLIASDNRAVTAVARGAGLTPRALVEAVNEKARALGLTHTHFEDPSGLNGNVSTPREVAIALREALADPLLADIMTTPIATVRSVDERPIVVDYFNTNQVLRAGRWQVLGGKTGYTDEARYCLAIAASWSGRRIGMVFLGAEGELTRFADFNRVAGWIDAGGVEAKAETRPAVASDVGKAVEPPPSAVTPKIVKTKAK